MHVNGNNINDLMLYKYYKLLASCVGNLKMCFMGKIKKCKYRLGIVANDMQFLLQKSNTGYMLDSVNASSLF